jgi:SGF29 tudor-like domain
VIDLSGQEDAKKYCRGEVVLAVYPGEWGCTSYLMMEYNRCMYAVDTSTFYPATIVLVNRRGNSYDYTASLQFEGDADELGVTPVRIISLRHIMRVPE